MTRRRLWFYKLTKRAVTPTVGDWRGRVLFIDDLSMPPFVRVIDGVTGKPNWFRPEELTKLF